MNSCEACSSLKQSKLDFHRQKTLLQFQSEEVERLRSFYLERIKLIDEAESELRSMVSRGNPVDSFTQTDIFAEDKEIAMVFKPPRREHISKDRSSTLLPPKPLPPQRSVKSLRPVTNTVAKKASSTKIQAPSNSRRILPEGIKSLISRGETKPSSHLLRSTASLTDLILKPSSSTLTHSHFKGSSVKPPHKSIFPPTSINTSSCTHASYPNPKIRPAMKSILTSELPSTHFIHQKPTPTTDALLPPPPSRVSKLFDSRELQIPASMPVYRPLLSPTSSCESEGAISSRASPTSSVMLANQSLSSSRGSPNGSVSIINSVMGSPRHELRSPPVNAPVFAVSFECANKIFNSEPNKNTNDHLLTENSDGATGGAFVKIVIHPSSSATNTQTLPILHAKSPGNLPNLTYESTEYSYPQSTQKILQQEYLHF